VNIIKTVKKWAKELKRNILALYFCYKDPEMPLLAKIVTALVVGYALSPIDLIPDFIPIIGYLDDLLIVPLGIKISIYMIPPELFERNKIKAGEALKGSTRKNWIAGMIVIGIWLLLILSILVKALR